MSSTVITGGIEERVPVKPKMANRFYEPIVLIRTLNEIWSQKQIPQGIEEPKSTTQTRKSAFQTFVNKLAQVCDTQRMGKTVSAIAILQHPDRIEYVFASNERDAEALAQVQDFIYGLIQLIAKTEECRLATLNSVIMRRIIIFGRNRIHGYINSLKLSLPLCLSSIANESTNLLDRLRVILNGIQKMVDICNADNPQDDAFSRNCEKLIKCISRLYSQEFSDLIRQMSNEDKMNQSECWWEFRHATTRLQSYIDATKRIIKMRIKEPELFVNFEVSCVPSSRPSQCPLKTNRRSERLNMKGIINRMMSDKKMIAEYHSYSERLERFGVDEELRDECWDKRLRPIVHAEVLVLDHLLKTNNAHTTTFFGSWKYIGSSKPTCRLCDYYFTCHPSRIEVRPTHRNLYPNWRLPDVLASQGNEAIVERERLMTQILGLVRKDALNLLIEKNPERKTHDSNTEPTQPVDPSCLSDYASSDSLLNTFSRLDLKLQ